MLLDHAVTVSEARSCIAALADERALIELDWIHGDDVPALDGGLTDNRAVLIAVATCAVVHLVGYGVDALQVELLLASLADARALDEP
jgi:hypothetical protein